MTPAPQPESPSGPEDAALLRQLQETTERLRKSEAHLARFQNIAAEEAARSSEDRYRSIFEHAVEGIFRSTPEGRYIAINPAFARIHGYDSPAEMIENCQDIARDVYVIPSRREDFKRLIAQFGEVAGFEHQSRRKDGRICWISLNARAVRDASGTIAFYEGSIVDITERKRHEQQTAALSDLARRLNSTKTELEAAEVIVNAADRLLGWDAASLDLYSAESDQIKAVLNIDTIGGLRQPCAPSNNHAPPSRLARRTIDHGPLLILRHPPFILSEEAIPFGDTAKPSASLLFVPVRDGSQVIGVLSIQSYTRDAYDRESLATLETLADSCGGALNRIKAETALRASEERYQLAVTGSTAALWDWNLLTDEVYYAPRLRELLGYSENEFPPHFRSLANALHPDDAARVDTAIRLHLERNAPYDVECRLATKSGQYRWINARGQALRDGSGKPYRMAGSILDITARQQAEEERIKNEQLYRFLFDRNPLPMWIYDLQTLRFIEVNHAAIDQYGYSREEFLAMTIKDIRPAEDVARLLARIQEMKDTSSRPGIWRHRYKNGVIIDAEVMSQSIKFDGRAASLVLANNVTERKQAQERIAEQAALLNETQDAILVKDFEGRILFWNRSAERIFGWTAAEALGKRTYDIIGETDASLEEALRAVLEKGAWSSETQRRTRSGKMVTLESQLTLVRDGAGNAKSILAIHTDISERKLLEAQFLRAQRMESIGTLAGGIAHDLNNVLAPILMSIDLLRMNTSDPENWETLDMIETSAKRGAGMVQQVLSFARGLDGQRVPVQVRHLLKDIEKLVIDTFPKSIRFKNTLRQDLWPLIGDPTQLHQVFLNLCVNARDAMPAGGQLSLKAENCVLDENYTGMTAEIKPGRYVAILVSDTGCGIPQHIIDRIFEPFFTTKEIGKGTGLGLSTVLAIVKSHGGCINVYSEINRGTTFKICLPAAPDTPEDQSVRAEIQFPRGNGELILIVDDEASIRGVAQQTLRAFGYAAITACDGSEAVAIYAKKQNEIAVVITDMMMPIMDGPATIHTLTKMNPHVKIIGASGMHSNGGVAKAINAGVKHFLPKPYTADTLLQTLQKVLHGGAD